jgi:hypothetical protein
MLRRKPGVMTMRHLVVLLMFMAALAAPAAGEYVRLPYTLTFSGTAASGTIAGEWGGMPVQGAYANGQWVIVSGGAPVVGGAYRCGGGCTFEGTVIYGPRTSFSLDAPGLDDTGTATASGSLSIDLKPPYLE